jgi:cell division protein FtsL
MIRSEAKLNAESEVNPVASGEPDNALRGTGDESKETEITTGPLQDAAVEEAPSGIAGRSRRKHHHSHRHRRPRERHHWSERSKLLLGILVLALLANFIIALFFGIRMYLLNQEDADLRAELRTAQEEVDRLKPELEKSLAEIESLLKGQLPGLTKIEYDQVITLNEKYLRNIIFNKVSGKNLRGYEFRVVIRNETLGTIWPEFKVHFFDEHGLHLNSIRVGDEKEALMKVGPLGPGEERSDSSAVIKLSDNEKMPYFFLIRIN